MAQDIKALGWESYRLGASMVNPYKRGTAEHLDWQEGYNASERDAAQRLHRRSWDRDGQYGPVPSATQPTGAEVYREDD